MSKKKKAILIIAVFATIIVAFCGGQAFSKYVTKLKGEGVAEIATWDFKVNGQTKQVQTINLNSTYDNQTLEGNKIAPGTSGSFNIIVDASDTKVGINYKIEFLNEINKPTNLKFIYDNVKYNSVTDLEDRLSGSIYANEENKEKILNIKWIWDYETGNNEEEISNNDIIDTKDAINMKNYTFDINISGSQIIPQK
ncbi:MAG: hypothetical protein HFJ40_06540 [Clostridia bacterium]|nr:hypothetical protein [Clostridia bacterium]